MESKCMSQGLEMMRQAVPPGLGAPLLVEFPSLCFQVLSVLLRKDPEQGRERGREKSEPLDLLVHSQSLTCVARRVHSDAEVNPRVCPTV